MRRLLAVLAVLPLLAGGAGAAEVAYRVVGKDARLMLRWKGPVKYSVKRLGSLYLFRFSRQVRGNLAPFAASVRSLVREARLVGSRRVLLLRTTHQDVAVRHRKTGNSVVISLRGHTTAAGAKGSGSKPVGPQVVPLAVAGLPKAGRYRLDFRWKVPFEYRLAAQKRRITLVFSRAGRILLPGVSRRALRQRGVTFSQRNLAGKIIVTLVFEKEVTVRPSRRGTALRLDVITAAGAADGGTADRKPDGAITPRLSVSTVGGGTRLTFDWPVSVSAAAFRYGGHLWIVFGAPARFDLAVARKRLGKDVEDIEQTLLDNATIVRLRTSSRISAVLDREGWEWRVTLRRGRLLPRTPIFVNVDPKQGRGGTVAMRAGAAGSVITITDPAVGSTLFILPLRAPGLGVERERRFPTFRLLRSVQGIVVEPMSDGLTVAVRGDTVEITNPHGLFVSGER